MVPTTERLAFRKVYDEHFRFVWRALRRLGVRESDLADAAQDVFVVVHRKLAEFEGRSLLSTWLFAICLRVASDRRKLAHVRRQVDDEDLVYERADDQADVAAEVERRQGLAVLGRLLDELSFEQRAVFTMFELEAMSSETIALILEVPLGTVYSRLRTAREQFRAATARFHARQQFQAAAAGAGR